MPAILPESSVAVHPPSRAVRRATERSRAKSVVVRCRCRRSISLTKPIGTLPNDVEHAVQASEHTRTGPITQSENDSKAVNYSNLLPANMIASILTVPVTHMQ